ncbi:hypothetical protein [Roseibacillus ishigakijimensis]|uniref:Uncharacterized protein n=1 Tax=Roseibacillus ishigakijimensis TaxID=454146 RepID=A0A934VMB1_9BACT|nr:hypothetical protein [Roseibacillus ishigakijimensis]MBK1833911.1 hypothetical protein [Roseibacillus ishigakijimensis]
MSSLRFLVERPRELCPTLENHAQKHPQKSETGADSRIPIGEVTIERSPMGIKKFQRKKAQYEWNRRYPKGPNGYQEKQQNRQKCTPHHDHPQAKEFLFPLFFLLAVESTDGFVELGFASHKRQWRRKAIGLQPQSAEPLFPHLRPKRRSSSLVE